MTLAAHQIPLTDRETDAVQILRFMESVRRRREVEPYIRECATRILRGVPDHDQQAQAARLLDFVKTKVIYVLDPVGTEYITDPVIMLRDIRRRGEARGDCDDHALLLASLLGSVGVEARCAAVKLKDQLPEGEDYYNHVIAQAYIGGEWIDLDPCAKRQPQPAYPDKLTIESDPINQTLEKLMHTLADFYQSTLPQPHTARRQPVNAFAAGLGIDWGGLFNNVIQGGLNLGFDIARQQLGGNRQNVIASGGGTAAGGTAYQAQQQAPGSGQLIAGIDNKTLLLGAGALILLPRLMDSMDRRRRR